MWKMEALRAKIHTIDEFREVFIIFTDRMRLQNFKFEILRWRLDFWRSLKPLEPQSLYTLSTVALHPFAEQI